MLKIDFLEAQNGDCIHIQLFPSNSAPKNILIDGGVSATYDFRNSKGRTEKGPLANLIDQLRNENQKIDLLILTHIDDDHIDGILKWFKTDQEAHNLIGEVWFNSGKLIAEYLEEQENESLNHVINLPDNSNNTSVNQGVEFGQYIHSKGIWRREIIMQGVDIEWNEAKFEFLSPDKTKLHKLLKFWKKNDPGLNTSGANDYHHPIQYLIEHDSFDEDNREPNGSSIAFILNFEGRRYLFLGDSHPSVIEEGLIQRNFTPQDPLRIELVKLSHHGSKTNTSKELLSLINSSCFIISTNGSYHGHPDKQLIARLIKEKNGCQIYFNYPERSREIFLAEDFAFLPFRINNSKSEFIFSNGN